VQDLLHRFGDQQRTIEESCVVSFGQTVVSAVLVCSGNVIRFPELFARGLRSP
jgi:hypothetical protein